MCVCVVRCQQDLSGHSKCAVAAWVGLLRNTSMVRRLFSISARYDSIIASITAVGDHICGIISEQEAYTGTDMS